MTKTNIFHDQTEKSMTFQAWKMIFQNSITFQVSSHDPVQTLSLNELFKMTQKTFEL